MNTNATRQYPLNAIKHVGHPDRAAIRRQEHVSVHHKVEDGLVSSDSGCLSSTARFSSPSTRISSTTCRASSKWSSTICRAKPTVSNVGHVESVSCPSSFAPPMTICITAVNKVDEYSAHSGHANNTWLGRLNHGRLKKRKQPVHAVQDSV